MNPYGDYLPGGDPYGTRREALSPQRHHWAHLDDQGLLDPADCVQLGGHCWAPTNLAFPTDPPRYPERCRHCPATRVGTRREPMEWTYPQGQP